jgi:hypothetical protein
MTFVGVLPARSKRLGSPGRVVVAPSPWERGTGSGFGGVDFGGSKAGMSSSFLRPKTFERTKRSGTASAKETQRRTGRIGIDSGMDHLHGPTLHTGIWESNRVDAGARGSAYLIPRSYAVIATPIEAKQTNTALKTSITQRRISSEARHRSNTWRMEDSNLMPQADRGYNPTAVQTALTCTLLGRSITGSPPEATSV